MVLAARPAEAGGCLEARSSRPGWETQLNSCLTKHPCLLENGIKENVCSAAVLDDSRPVLNLLALTDRSPFPGEPRKGQLLFPKEPNPLHHPSRTRKYLPHHLCLFHQIWKESVGKKLLSVWDPEGGLTGRHVGGERPVLPLRVSSQIWFSLAGSKRFKDCDQILFFSPGFQSRC